MNLQVTPAEWAAIEAAGSGVLFRKGEFCPACQGTGLVDGMSHTGDIGCSRCKRERRRNPRMGAIPKFPPAEFVEAAQACGMCEGGVVPCGWIHPKLWGGRPGPCNAICPDCHNGKRRVAVVVEHLCFHEGQRLLRKDVCDCGTDDGLVTVGHVVVTWGPLVVVGRANTDWSTGEHIFEADWRRWVPGKHGPHPVGESITLPPDVDPQSLVGQYAIDVKVVA